MSLDYVFLRKCGCLATWISEDLAKREIAKEVAKGIKRNYDMQRMETEQARRTPMTCDVCKTFPKKEKTG